MTFSRRPAALLAASTIVSIATLSFPELGWGFSDVSSKTPERRAIEALREKGVVEGYGDGTFRAGNTINRAEFLKIVLEGRVEEGTEEGTYEGSQCFPDVRDEWFAKYVCTAKAEGIVAGYPEGLFHPERFINFVEASKILTLAFKQEIAASSPDWYESYVRALEGGKAIPPSIGTLDEKITRGEMAEMLWRLTEGIESEPAKGYLNVKYPEIAVNMTEDTPQRAESCADLRAFAEEAAREGGRGFGATLELEDRAMEMGAPAAANAQRTAGSTTDYSRTNVQVEGVDEADIVKTDGTYLYALTAGKVRIAEAHPPSAMRLLATLDLGEGFIPQDLYLDRNRLAVIGNTWGGGGPMRMMEDRRSIAPELWSPIPYEPPKAKVSIYDVTDPASPKLERTVALEGTTVSTRRIEGKLYLVVNQATPWWGGPIPLKDAKEEILLPRIEDSRKGNDGEPVARCSDVLILPRIPSPQYLTVAVIPLRDPQAEVKREVVLGSAENIYASLENLYVATTEWTYDWTPRPAEVPPGNSERTNIYRFAFTENGVALEAQGSVPGHILNQFSMDEFERIFRIATTSNSWGAEGTSSNLYILSHDFVRLGEISGIAPGEQIYSTRFLGDRVYLVTFRTIDPLFVIDTSNPRAPKILGKLKIPGFSNYLHPYDEDHILGFGKEAVESKDGSFAWQQGMKIALFDVSDVEHPQELHRTVIGDRGTDSPLLQNHKALIFDRSRNLLAFPVTVYELTSAQKAEPDPGSAYGSPVFQGAYVYELTLEDGFELKGRITHYVEEDLQKMGDVWYPSGVKNIERILRIEESLLTVSPAAIQSHALQGLKKEGGVAF